MYEVQILDEDIIYLCTKKKKKKEIINYSKKYKYKRSK